MNFLIFDNEQSSYNLIKSLLADFNHVKLFTSNDTSSTLTASSFLKIKKGNIINATEVLNALSEHEHDPFDAVLLFNMTKNVDFNNVVQTLTRLKRKTPYLFLIYIDNRQNEIEKDMNKVLNESSNTIEWDMIISNQIDFSEKEGIQKYRATTEPNTYKKEPMPSINISNFLIDEIKTKKYLHRTVYVS